MASKASQKEHLRKVNAIIEMNKTGYYTCKEYMQVLGMGEYVVRNIARKHKIPLKASIKLFSKDTICWNCANYCKCSWHKTFTPVDGWTAEKVIKNGVGETYCVKSCPMFKKSEKRNSRPITEEEEKLIADLFERMRD